MNLPQKIPTPYEFYRSREEVLLEMGVGEKGLKYEKKVYHILKKASQDKRISNRLTDIGLPKGNDCNQPDITLTLDERNINIEVKSKFDDPLGNFSIRHILGEDDFDLSTDILDYKDKESLSQIFQNKIEDIDRYIKFAQNQKPESYNGKINQFPMYITQKAAKLAAKEGLAKAIANYSQKDEFDIDMVAGLYNNGKNTYYIQIGGYGLYYLGHDKYKLRVPKLEGNCIVEIRPFASGVKERKDPETGKIVKVVSMGLRASPRMTSIKNKSKYTLDDNDSIIRLFA